MDKVITERWLRSELRKWYGRKNVINRLIMYVYGKLTLKLTPGDLQKVYTEVKEVLSRHGQELKTRKDRKINALIMKKQLQYGTPQPAERELNAIYPTPIGNDQSGDIQHVNTVPQFHPRVVNLSKIDLSPKEEELLSLGFKYALPPLDRENASINVIADLTVKIGVHHGLLEECANFIRNNEIPQCPTGKMSIIKSLQGKCRKNDVLITKADKGPTIVLMDHSTYSEKIATILTGSGAVTCPQFDLKGLNRKVREAINGSN